MYCNRAARYSDAGVAVGYRLDPALHRGDWPLAYWPLDTGLQASVGPLVEVESLLSSGCHEPLPQHLLGTVVGQLEGRRGQDRNDGTTFLIDDDLSLAYVEPWDEDVIDTLR